MPSGTSIAAPAPTREAVATAKAHFEAGKRAFDEKRFEAAIGEFEQGQAAVPRPLFTFNIAQSYRRLAEAGDDGLRWTRRARDSYRLYIDTSNLNEPERVDALRHLLELAGRTPPRRTTTATGRATRVRGPTEARTEGRMEGRMEGRSARSPERGSASRSRPR